MPDSFDIDPREPAFDDVYLDDAVDDFLVGNDGPGVDVATVDVQARQALTQLLEIGIGDRPVLERAGDLLDLFRREHRIARDEELAHKHLQREWCPRCRRFHRRKLQRGSFFRLFVFRKRRKRLSRPGSRRRRRDGRPSAIDGCKRQQQACGYRAAVKSASAPPPCSDQFTLTSNFVLFPLRRHCRAPVSMHADVATTVG